MGTISCRDPSSTLLLSSIFFISFCLALFCDAANTITQGLSIRDGETLISSSQNFVLGFFSPENSTLRYIGIWYNKIPIQTVVWVGNRENPISGRAGVLALENDGNLVVKDGIYGTLIWSSNASVESKNSTAILMDNGNLVLSSSDDIGNTDKAYWQSFNDPTDNCLPGMKLRVNAAIGENRALISWKTENDPSPGGFSMGIDPRGSPQVVVWEQLNRRWRSGYWNGLVFTGVPTTRTLNYQGYKLSPVDGDGNMYLTYTPLNNSEIKRFRISWDGIEEHLRWADEIKEWTVIQYQPANECDIYNKCGSFGSCSEMNSPICSCIKGFEARDLDQWNKGNWSGGCVRRTQLQCERIKSGSEEGKEDEFLKLKMMKVPDFSELSSEAEGEDECKSKCLKNCSCLAYVYDTAIGCMLWIENLIDIQELSYGGADLYVRVANSQVLVKKRNLKVKIAIPVLIGSIAIAICTYFSRTLMAKRRAKMEQGKAMVWFNGGEAGPDFSDDKLQELPLFNFEMLATATNNFHIDNKLGQGGFGPVYKGKLQDGQEIAVKRLSKASGQGLEEFMNEVVVISKLQHRNLVRLLGCCVEGGEKMLLYEYMPNKSLDSFLFDPLKQEILHWRKRKDIIEGVGRGLLYLHRDSRLRIIHRDLKASNILLDEELNPKISDFGMARIFGSNQHQADTRRVVGTYGYMSPEYAMEGRFSEKSDVFSFGVLLLEIVSGRRNTSFYQDERSPTLLGVAWKLWNEDNGAALIDPVISDRRFQIEILRCIHVGLLCVQEFAKDRPTMSAVLLMLSSEIVDLPKTKQPAFTGRQITSDTESSQQNQKICSINNVTITAIEAR